MDQQQKLGEAVYQYDIRALIARVKNSEMFIYEAAEKIENIIREQMAKEQK